MDISRPKPYDRPQRLFDRVPSPGTDGPPALRDPLPTKRADPSTFAQLFRQLISVAAKEPLAFESKALAICASFDLDPTTSEDIINSVKQQFPAIRNQETTCVSKTFSLVQPLMSTLSVPPASGGPTNANPTTSSAPAQPPGSATPPPMPLKQQRAFTSGPRGFTVWYSTQSSHSLTTPPPGLQASAGMLYAHTDTTLKLHQTWLCDTNGKWIDVTGVDNVKHPTISDRFLLLCSDGIPSWLTKVDYSATQAQRQRATR